MEKKHFGALVLGVVGGLVFGMGMCMCLITEWNLFKPGVIVGCVGAVLLLATVIVCRKIAGCAPVRLSIKLIAKALYGIIAALVLGAGMSMIMAFEGMMLQGMVLGIVGIVLLLGLIPMCIGFKKSETEA